MNERSRATWTHSPTWWERPCRASGSDPELPFAFLFDGSDAALANLTVRGEPARIVISGGDPRLEELVLDGVGRVYSLDPGQPTPTGLDLNDGTTATVTNSVLRDTDVDIESGSSPTITANEFLIGAIWMEGAYVAPVIRDNRIVDSVKWGISVNALRVRPSKRTPSQCVMRQRR